MKKKEIIISSIIFLFCTTGSISSEFVKKKIKSRADKKIDELIFKTSDFISNFAQNNFENLKHLEFNTQVRENLKPTFNVMSVTEIFQTNSGTFFNQTSLNTHDSDETINIGLGVRELSNDDKLLIGSNIFYDYQFDEQHKRIGIGLEAISSVFDIRGNYYNALSGNKNTDDGSERALDGWDAQLDYHLPLTRNHELNIFANLFRFENPAENSDYEEKGNKIGANTGLGNWVVEAGYLNDNQANDSYFGSIKYVAILGGKIKKDYYAMSEIKDPISDKKMKDSYRTTSFKNKRKALEYRSVRDKLYLPVKRENKIRVVKISKAGIVASGF
tara:strand:- start:442 stop:1431 length:990 start_codon:yes stop_codon:yes gene_type:complete